MCHRKKNSHGQHSNNILFSMPKVELTIERKTFTTNSRCRYWLVVTRFMTRNSKNWHSFTMKISRHLKSSLALIQHAWKQQNTAKGWALILNENTCTHTNSHQMNQNETTAVSLTRSSRMETGKSNMHIFTGWARALCRLNRDLGSILPNGESAGCCPGACFILWECCSPLSALSLIHNSLPPSLSLPFKSECTGALYFANKNCSPLSVYFSSLVTRSTNRNLLQLSLKLSCHLLLSHQETVRNLNDSTSSQRFLLHIVSLSNNLQTM